MNCKDCTYRMLLARIFNVHVDKFDCDRCGTEYCKKQQCKDGVEK